MFRIKELQQFVENNFLVAYIAEEMESCEPQDEATRVRRRMTARQYQVMAVRREGRNVGYVRAVDLTGGVCGDHLRPFTQDDLVGSKAPIMEVLSLLGERSYLFVLERTSVGQIVTRADLQKPPVRMLLFSLVSLLESAMLSLVRLLYPNDSFRADLTPGRWEKAEQLLQLRMERDESIDMADCLQLSDKRDLLLKQPRFLEFFGWSSKKQADQYFQRTEMLRDNLVHAQPVASGEGWREVAEVAEQTAHFLRVCERRKEALGDGLRGRLN